MDPPAVSDQRDISHGEAGIVGIDRDHRPGCGGFLHSRRRRPPRWSVAAGRDGCHGTCRLGRFNQNFGLMATAGHWRVKQGWLCCVGDRTIMHSTGLIDHDRFAIALLTESGRTAYGEDGRHTVTLMAQALLPGGTLPGLA